MTNPDNMALKLNAVKTIKDEDVKAPSNIPVDVYLQEAENLYHWAQEDKEKLAERGLDWNLVQDVPARADVLRDTESKWVTTRFTQEEAEKKWALLAPDAYDFRDDLLQTFRFAYRNAPDILGRVSAISEGYGHADMIQDLSDLSALGKSRPAELSAIKFDLSILDKTSKTADELADLLGMTTAERADAGEAIKLRNKAFTHLKEAVDEIYAYGQFVFRHDERRLKGYSSDYLRRKRNKRGKKESKQEASSSV